jgi:hypothetical protein
MARKDISGIEVLRAYVDAAGERESGAKDERGDTNRSNLEETEFAGRSEN